MDQRAVHWAASIYTPTCQEGNAHSPTLGINHVLMFVSLTDKNQYLILIHICLVLNETVFFFFTYFLGKWQLSCCFPFLKAAATAAKSLQSCPTLCDPIDGNPSGSSVPGILQARILGWVAISSSNAWKWKVKAKSLSRVRLFATPWTVAYQAPPSMGFSRWEYWSGVPFPSPISRQR